MRRGLLISLGIAIMAVGSAGLTELTLAAGLRHTADPIFVATPKSSPKPSISPSPTPSASPAPVITPAPTPTPLIPPTGPQATTNDFVRLRAQPNTSSAILEGLDGGTVVGLTSYQDAQWQGVTVHGQSGYIYRSYLNY